MNRVARYGFNLLIALDQLANTVCGGSPDETISSRLSRLSRTSRLWAWCRDRIDSVFGKGHCARAEVSEQQPEKPTWN